MPGEPSKGTGFHRNEDGCPVLLDYHIRGFFKDACGMLRRVDGTLSKRVRAYRKIVDGLIFVQPRQIVLQMPGGEDVGILDRPLRASTAQGERVSLARSEMCPARTEVSFTVVVLGPIRERKNVLPVEELLREWLSYGQFHGIGQWRNAGWGAFTYEMEKA